MKKGTLIRKRNFTSFAGKPYILVETVQTWSSGSYMVNGRFIIHPDNVIVLTREEADQADLIWNDCTLKEHVHVEGRVPCSRADGESKKEVAPEHVQAKLYEIRMRRGDLSFQAYTCPDCKRIHIGRNPYVPKDTINKSI